MGQTKEQKVIKQLTQTPQVQKLTPISEGMFLPNHSGRHHNLTADRIIVGDTITIEWDDLVSGNLISSDNELNIEATGDLWLSTYSGGDIYLHADGNVYCNNDFLPQSSATYDLGSSSSKWEDIHTDGDIYLYKTTTNDYKLTSNSIGHLALEGQTSGAQTQLTLYTKDGDGTDGNFFIIAAKGTAADSTNSETLTLQYGASSQIMVLKSIASGSGTVRPLYLYTGANTSQVVLNIDGTTTISKGVYYSDDGSAGIDLSCTGAQLAASTSIVFKNGILTARSTC